jgi:hypothetical protein
MQIVAADPQLAGLSALLKTATLENPLFSDRSSSSRPASRLRSWDVG